VKLRATLGLGISKKRNTGQFKDMGKKERPTAIEKGECET
jgi:hypothetical protein